MTTLPIPEARQLLQFAFENTAEWRSDLVARFPDDDRNAPAAAELLQLAETIKDVPDALMAQYASFGMSDSNTASVASERQSEMLKSVGFSGGYENAADFVRELVA